MQSLAAAAAVIVTVVWGVGLTAIGLSLGGARLTGGCLGLVGIALAGSLGYSLPHGWLVWLPPLMTSAWAVLKMLRRLDS